MQLAVLSHQHLSPREKKKQETGTSTCLEGPLTCFTKQDRWLQKLLFYGWNIFRCLLKHLQIQKFSYFWMDTRVINHWRQCSASLHIPPFDVSFFGLLTTFYNQQCAQWPKDHPGRVITQNQIGELFTSAYGKATTIKNAPSGFSKSGICPFNPCIFPDEIFEPAETTDRLLEQTGQ